MMRKFVSMILLTAMSAGVMALGLGNIQLNSGLNQPFDARIDLLSPSAPELDSLTIRLADSAAFTRAGIERSFILTSLRFEVQQAESGNDYIHITSREALREPFLNFLIEASWSNGKLFREYTVLLDPPLYEPNTVRQLINDDAATVGQAPSTMPVGPVESAAPSAQEYTGDQAIGTPFTGNEVGPVAASETLWSVASRVRPDSSVSVNQMMLALLRANPESFIGNNINGLKQGQILRVPDSAEINSTSYETAIEEVRAQNAMWEEIRGNIAATATERPLSPAVETVQQAPVANTRTESGSELRLMAAGDQTIVDAGQTGVGTSTGSTDTSAALMSEQMESLTSENTDLRDRLTESEQIIQDLRRLIELKDDELATLQQQIGSGQATPATVEGPIEQEPTATAVEAEVTEPVAEEGPVAGDETVTTDETATEGSMETEESTLGTTDEAGAETVDESTETVAEEAVAEEVSEPAPMIEVESTDSPGLVDALLGFVTGNLPLVGGLLVVIILAAAAPTIIRKRREAASQAELALPADFPDFDTAEAGADVTDGPQIDVGMDKETADHHEPAVAEQMSGVAERHAVPVDVAAAAAPVAAEEDPLAEVNVFLAYEHFDSAEEFVRDAITRQPNNLDFHSKLLEVFYSAGDKVKYEEEARVLNDLVNGSGPHWEMAAIMWQEMSPNRALFAAPAEGEDDARADSTSGRGIVDLTADDDAAADDAALDFDLGALEEASSPSPASKAAGGDDMLDITAGSDDVLDVTASESRAQDEEDILDVTAAVGLDPVRSGAADDDSLSLDLPGADDQDILDISTSGTDDLLDVTAHADLDAEQDQDLLDISMAGAGDSPEPAGTTGKADDNLLDFDVGSLEVPAAEAMDAGADQGGIELDFGSETNPGDSGLEMSLDTDGQGDGGLELDFAAVSNSLADEGGLELSLDSDSAVNDGGLELDFEGSSDADAGTDSGLSLDMGLEDTGSLGIDMDSTVKIPKRTEISLEGLDEDDDEGDHTVFVARTTDAGTQSADDENATKLDLAKAYVELGDGSNAKSILEEVIADGNPAQRKQAQELMAQLG